MRAVGHIRRVLGQHPLLVDVMMAVATAGVSLVLGQQDPPAHFRALDLLGYTLTCLANVTLAARRRGPMLVLVLYCAIWACYIAAGYWPVVNSAGALLAFYTVAAHRPPRMAALAAALLATTWLYAGATARSDSMWTVLAQSIVWTGVIGLIGSRSRQLAQRSQRLKMLATRLRRDRAEQARRAVTSERLRIARELHDVVAHHMSVISVQAGLAQYVGQSDPVTARAALDTVLHSSGEALQEMRRMLAMLRINGDEDQAEADAEGAADHHTYRAAPGLARLDALVDRLGVAGVTVEVVVVGTPRPLGAGPDMCAYRVIQECLTNVLRHAGTASATVTLRYLHGRFVAQVSDTGRGMAEPPDGSRPQHGLIGMRERAGIYGGTIVAGNRPEGGFEVILTLPTPPDGSGVAGLEAAVRTGLGRSNG